MAQLKSFDDYIKHNLTNTPQGKHEFDTDVVLAKIGAMIASRRIDKHLTQVQLGKLAHIPQSSVARIENGGNTSIDTIVKIFEALKENVPEIKIAQ